MSIHEHDNVNVIAGRYEGSTGRVRSVYPTLDIAVVMLDTGDVAKILLDHLVKFEPKENVESNIPVKENISEGAKAINEKAFMSALLDITTFGKDESRNYAKMAALAHGMIVKKRLFVDNDVIVVTKNQFVAMLWDLCSPQTVAENSHDRENIADALMVSIPAILMLSDLVEIFFDND